MQRKSIKLRKPNNKYMKAYVKAVKEGYKKLGLDPEKTPIDR